MTKSDTELGGDLLALRGVQWIMGTKNDPYALLLRGADDDPHALGRGIRERGALYRSHAEAWVTADHAMAEAILNDPRLGPGHPDAAPAEGGGHEPDEEHEPMPWDFPALRDVLPLDDACLSLPRAEYERVNAAGAAILGAPALAPLAEGLTAGCALRLRGLSDRFDLMAEYAHRCAADAAAEVLGLPAEQRDRFTDLCARAAGTLDATLCPPRLDVARRLLGSVAELRALLAGTVPAEGAGAVLAPEDALTAGVLTAVAGVELTATLICNTVAVLLDHPEAWAVVCEAPEETAGQAVDETLRYLPPVRLHRLYAQSDLALGGHEVERGAEVVVAAEAALRDPAVYPDPERFRLGRPAAGSAGLPLSAAPHLALVAPLVRLQAVCAVRALAARFPGLSRTEPVLRRLRSPITAAVLHLPLTVR
ncbi:hypothetical protein HEK616_47330 [Streptomyces nigrescens]|nr:hypothetical protein HEK616_47330 [Streptomyces nigrescens]